MNGEVRLADLIQELGRQLVEAQQRARESDPSSGLSLELKECSVELAVTWERAAGGGLDLKVVKLDREHTRADTQTLTVTLVPVDPGL